MKILLHPQRPALWHRAQLQCPAPCHALVKKDPATEVTIFLMGDAVVCAKGQKTPDGYYNLERMLKRVVARQRRGPALRHLHGRARHDRSRVMEGARRSSMDELAAATLAADKVLSSEAGAPHGDGADLPRLQREHADRPGGARGHAAVPRRRHYGNPSSGHWAGAPAQGALDAARGQVAALLGCAPTRSSSRAAAARRTTSR